MIKSDTDHSLELEMQLEKKVQTSNEEFYKLSKRHNYDIMQLVSKEDFAK